MLVLSDQKLRLPQESTALFVSIYHTATHVLE